MKLSGTIEKLQQQTLVAVPDRARKAIEQENGALTDAEWAEVLASPEFKEREAEMALSAYVTAIATALDGWQARIEKRIDDLEEEVLAKALREVEAEPGPSVAMPGFDEAKARIAKGARVTDHRFEIGESGSSGGDREKPKGEK